MFELDKVVRQVLHNCSVSDSRYAGLYSICGLALRLRDLYKWEMGLQPWVEKESSEILEWIEEKEQKWLELAEKDFDEITILGNRYDPFDTEGINSQLELHGLFYGAGYVHSLKPSFFLAYLENQKEIVGYPVYVLGRELARDLLTVPAFSQGGAVILRKESARLFLWNNILFTQRSGQQALRFGLENYGVPAEDTAALRDNLARITAAELETFMYHELGGLNDIIFEPGLWREIIATFPHTPVELLSRVVKDLLADTNEYGTLRHIASQRKTASLAFYVAFLDGLRKVLFPELVEAFRDFRKTGGWWVIEEAISSGYKTAASYAEAIASIYRAGRERNDMKWVESEIDERLLKPLGAGKQSPS